MQLTDEQVETARALGCRFVAATEAQVRQFSMQRRIFTIGGAPFLAARQDGFYETAGTLGALIAGGMRTRETAMQAEPEVVAEPQAVAEEEPEVVAQPVAEAEPEDEAAEPVHSPPAAVAPATPLPRFVAQLPSDARPVMAATVTIVKGYARRGTLDTGTLTALVTSVHRTLQRLR